MPKVSRLSIGAQKTMSKWREPSDEEKLKAFLAKQQTVDVQPAYYRTADVDSGATARMETGREYKTGGSGSFGSGTIRAHVEDTQTCFECRTQQPKLEDGEIGERGALPVRTNLAQGSKFCAGCGAKLGPPPAAAGTACSSCGASNTPGAKFCSSCGFNLTAPAAPPPTCACGVLKTNAKFCANCGSKWH